jgi:hypothetical protein
MPRRGGGRGGIGEEKVGERAAFRAALAADQGLRSVAFENPWGQNEYLHLPHRLCRGFL